MTVSCDMLMPPENIMLYVYLLQEENQFDILHFWCKCMKSVSENPGTGKDYITAGTGAQKSF